MTELEPVAWRFRWTYPKTGEATTWTLADREEVARQRADEGYEAEPLVTLSSAQSAIAERDARIAELEAAKWQVRHVDTANDLVSMGLARAAAEARAEAAEALLNEAGPVIRQYIEKDEIEGVILTSDINRLRAARAIHHKIGVKDE